MNKLKNLLLTASLLLCGLFIVQPVHAASYTMFGVSNIPDGLPTGWTNKSIFNGVNTCNIIDTEQVYAGTHSLSCIASGPFEFASFTSPTLINVDAYTYLNFYASASQDGQRYEIGFVDTSGAKIGTWVALNTGGGPLQAKRFQLYSFPLTVFGLPTPTIGGFGLKDSNGAPQPKVFFDEVQLSDAPGTPAVVSPVLGQPATPTLVPKPKGPYYPNISPWVFIIPAIIIMLAIFFE